MLAVRWSAPESILNRQFSSASDVWAYGITAHEIFTNGQRPYNDLKTNQSKHLKSLPSLVLTRVAVVWLQVKVRGRDGCIV